MCKTVWTFSAKILRFFFNFWIEISVIKITYLCWSFDGFFYSFAVGASTLLWWRPLFPFVVEVSLPFCGRDSFILLWWRPLYSLVVNNVDGSGFMPGFARNMAYFIFDIFCVIFWVLFCEDFQTKYYIMGWLHLVYTFHSYLKKNVMITMKNRIVLFLLWSLLSKSTKKVKWGYLAFYGTVEMSPFLK